MALPLEGLRARQGRRTADSRGGEIEGWQGVRLSLWPELRPRVLTRSPRRWLIENYIRVQDSEPKSAWEAERWGDFATRRQRSGWKLLQGGATKKSTIFQPFPSGGWIQASFFVACRSRCVRHRITPHASNLAWIRSAQLILVRILYFYSRAIDLIYA